MGTQAKVSDCYYCHLCLCLFLFLPGLALVRANALTAALAYLAGSWLLASQGSWSWTIGRLLPQNDQTRAGSE